MQIETLVIKYLTKLYSEIQNNKETGGAATPELSYRTQLHNFFVELSDFIKGDQVGIIHEPSSTGKGRPDFRFHDKTTFGVYGYIELKPFDDRDINIDDYIQQIDKYIQLGSNVILSDGLEFILFSEEEQKKVCLLKSKKKYLEEGAIKDNLGELEIFNQVFSLFLSHVQPRVVNQKTLINLLAKRANLIRYDAEMLINRPHKGTVNENASNNLKLIFGVFKEQLDENLDEETFSSLVGQILIFSLFVAYSELLEKNDIEINESNLRNYFLEHEMQTYRPLRALISILKDIGDEMGLIKAGWSDAALLLSYIQIGKEQLGNYHDLYEMFHHSYNPEEKMDFGAYATPIYLADYAVRLCQEVITSKLNSNMFNENVKIVDPSCGTGTFLEAVINLRNASNSKIYSQVLGVEILPVPYTLAQMRLNHIRARLDNDEKGPKVLLGNSLSNSIVLNDIILKLEDDDIESVKLLKEEYNELQYATSKPIVAIIGNPPSSDSGFNMGGNFTEIESALEGFRPPVSERGSRQNIQKTLQNDFVKFIMWACIKIDEIGGGVISFIVPNSALRDRSYVYMRSYLLSNYQEIYVLEFDEDLRKNDKQATRNIFKTMQGRTLITLVKKPSGVLEPQPASASVYYKSIKNEDKIKWLTERKENLILDYEEIQPYGWLKAFIPVTVENNKVKTYEKYISIEDIFVNHISGVKTGCTALVTHCEKNTLIRKLKEYSTEKVSDEELNEKYFKGQKVDPYKEGKFGRGWKRAFVAREIQKEYRENLILNYDFRPFLKSYIFYSKSVMKEASKDGGRARPELEKIFVDNNYTGNFALALAKNPSQISNELDQFVCVVDNLPDNDLSSRGNAYIFPTVFPERGAKELKVNIKDIILESIKGFYEDGTDIKKVANDLVLYIYSILSSNIYREYYYDIIYHGLLKGMVRVPLPKDKDIYFELRNLGEKLANAQFLKANINLSESSIEYEGDINIMLQKTVSYVENQTIVLQGNRKQEKFIFKNVPTEVFNYSIMGYDVLDTFIKYKKYPYLNRSLNENDCRDIITLIESLKKYIKYIEDIDSVIEDILVE